MFVADLFEHDIIITNLRQVVCYLKLGNYYS